MKAMVGLGLRACDERRRVVELVELHDLPIAERPEVGLGRAGSERIDTDVVRHEVEPGLDAAAFAVVPLAVCVLELRDVVRGRSHAVTSWSGRDEMGSEPRERARSYHTAHPWDTGAPDT